MSTKIVQVKPLTLNSNIGTSNTTAIVSGMIGLDGVDLTQADFGSIVYGTFEPNTPREEAVSFTITSNTAGVAEINFGVSGRGLIGKSPYGTGGITYAHSAGAKLVISNNPNLFNKFTAKDNDEVVTGAWEFPAPTADENPATKGYVDTEISNTEGLVTTEASARAAADTVLNNAMVKVTTDQTIAGIKTFSSSPIVPSATTGSQAVNKSQMEAYIAPLSGDIKASTSAFGTVKLDRAADNPVEPKALTATNARVEALAGGGDFGVPSDTNKFVTDEYLNDITNVIRGPVPSNFLPTPFYVQDIALSRLGSVSNSAERVAFGSSNDGTVVFLCDDANGWIFRFEKDPLTGAFLETHKISAGGLIDTNLWGSIVVLGSFVYIFSSTGNVKARRYNESDLTSPTTMTVPALSSGSSPTVWTDGIDFYLIPTVGGTTVHKWSVSGSVFSAVSTSTITAINNLDSYSTFFDGTNSFLTYTELSGTIKILKATSPNFATYTTKTIVEPIYSNAITSSNSGNSQYAGFGLNVNSNIMYHAVLYNAYDQTDLSAQKLALIPISKP